MKTFNFNLFIWVLLASHSFSIVAAPPRFVVGWGGNISGNVTGIPYSGNSTGVVVIADQVLSNVVAISAGIHHSLAIKSDGTVVGWGDNGGGRATGLKSAYPYRDSGVVTIYGKILSNAVAISACRFSAALKSDGTVALWGLDGSGYNISMLYIRA